MKIKIIYIISNTNKALAFEWLATYLDKKKFDPHFILLNPGDSSLERFFKQQGLPVQRIDYTGKKDVFKTFLSLYKIFKREKPSIVHTHLFDASLIGLMAARFAGIRIRIHTRHHSNSNKTYAPWAVKYDRLINRLSTNIIAISKNVADVLINDENVPSKKISMIHHGLDLTELKNVSEDRINDLRKKFGITNSMKPIIGVISRYIHLKGVQYIVPAFKELLKTHPNAFLLLANAKGNYSKEIKELLKEIPSSNYLEIEFEEDLFALYRLFDIYVHIPIDRKCEAFGQTYIEALACGVPSIFTRSGVANEFIEDQKHALVADYMDSGSVLEKMIVLLSNQTLCEKLRTNGLLAVHSTFNIKDTIIQHEQLYLECRNGFRATGI